MCASYTDEMQAAIAHGLAHTEAYISRGYALDQVPYRAAQIATTTEDCALLYLLIRHFKRKHVFEIGTYIAKSAVIMNQAVRKNGGILTTCDLLDYDAVPPYDGIRFIRGSSSVALSILLREQRKVDFCFIDWLPDDETLRLMQQVFTEDAIIAVHDYAPGQKGDIAVNLLTKTWCSNHDGEWLLPPSTPWLFDGIGINRCTAVYVPITSSAAHGIRRQASSC